MVDNKLTHKPDDTPILFVNFRDESFTGYWDKNPYTFAPHESKWLPRWLANHFAKSLVDDEMNERELPTDHSSRSSFVAKCLGEASAKDETMNDPLGIETLNKNKQAELEKPKHKGGRPKKVEEEFEEK